MSNPIVYKVPESREIRGASGEKIEAFVAEAAPPTGFVSGASGISQALIDFRAEVSARLGEGFELGSMIVDAMAALDERVVTAGTE